MSWRFLDKFASKREQMENQLEHMMTSLRQSKALLDYCMAKKTLSCNEKSQQRIRDFQKAEDDFSKVQSYGKWAPDYEKRRVALVEAKQVMDCDALVRRFKEQEKNVGILLDQLSVQIFQSVIPEIPIEMQASSFLSLSSLRHCNCSKADHCRCQR